MACVRGEVTGAHSRVASATPPRPPARTFSLPACSHSTCVASHEVARRSEPSGARGVWAQSRRVDSRRLSSRSLSTTRRRRFSFLPKVTPGRVVSRVPRTPRRRVTAGPAEHVREFRMIKRPLWRAPQSVDPPDLACGARRGSGRTGASARGAKNPGAGEMCSALDDIVRLLDNTGDGWI